MHNTSICPVCQTKLSSDYTSWHFLCTRCGYEKANLKPCINVDTAHQLIDESARATGLKKLRISNFRKLLNSIQSQLLTKGRLLDVGCAHGWFLDVARDNFEVMGIEPDKAVFDATNKRGLPVRLGYFPDVIDASEKFDVIIFNDVFEHIPDIESTLKHCYTHLNKQGVLVLNLPNSKGIFYKLSKLFFRLGFKNFFERLWQKDLPSPHLHYFNHFNLIQLLNRNGFETKVKGDLSTLQLNGLYTRIAYTGQHNKIVHFIIYIFVALSLPFLKILPSDIIYVVSSKKT